MIVVAQDGTGDFLTLQEAIISLPEIVVQDVDETLQCQEYRKIFIKEGKYKEQITLNKPFVMLIGEEAMTTHIVYDLYANMPWDDIGKLGTFRSYSFLIDTHDVVIKNLTIENCSGSGKAIGQAIAMYVDGDKIIFDGCRLLGNQDTLFTGPLPPKEIEKNGFNGPKQNAPRMNGRHYYYRCYICGDIDFIFGSATAYFEECELFSKNRDDEVCGYVTAASTPEGQAYGYVFEHCRFTSDCPKESVYLGRPWRDFAQTVILNSYLGDHIRPEGWHDWNKIEAKKSVFYGEYNNYGPGADTTHRVEWMRRLRDDLADENNQGTDILVNIKEYTSYWQKDSILGEEDCWNLTSIG